MKRVEMIDALSRRVIIIGNSGSGKSTLACKIGHLFGVPVIDLDSFHWEGNIYGHKRDEQVAREMVIKATKAKRWVIEGVFGWLANIGVEQATALIWLDLPWVECREGLFTRGERHGANETSFADLLAWSEDYWVRQTSSSFEGHLRLYESFPVTKLRLHSRNEVLEFNNTIDW